MFKEIESKDLEKRVSTLEDSIEYLIRPLLYDLAEKALMPHRVGWGSVLLLWMRVRWGTEKKEMAKKVLLEAAEQLALSAPGAWLQEYKEFVVEKKGK